MTAFQIFCLLLIMCQVLDAISTYRAIRMGGNEDNEYLVKLSVFFGRFTKAKWAWLFWSKFAATLLLAWTSIYFTPPDWQTSLFGILFIVYTAVIIHNFSLFRL